MSTPPRPRGSRRADLTAVAHPVAGGRRGRAAPERLAVALWLVTAGLAGTVLMGLELVAFRLYAPYFGYSIYVWGSLISVVMGALAGGYALGGVLADRWRTGRPLSVVLLAGAVWQLAMLWVARPLLASLSRSGDLAGPGLATLVVFVPPMTALAMVGPVVIRLLARAEHLGATAGAVYALSTAGGIAGVLVTSFVLVPRWGTQVTLEVLGGLSLLLGVAGLASVWLGGALVLALGAVLSAVPGVAWPPRTVWVGESAYNLVRVEDRGSHRLLVLNDERSVHTVRDTTGWTGRYFDDFALGPVLARKGRVLVLGMGAGGSVRSTRMTAPDAEIDAVEIDPMVVDVAARFFGVRPDARLRVHVADARSWLARDRGRYDVIQVDLYQGGPYVPFYLATVEFFALVRDRLAMDGVLMLNVFDANPAHEILLATGATLRQVFPSVMVRTRDVENNHLVLAFAAQRPVGAVRAQLLAAGGGPDVAELARSAAGVLADLAPPPGTPTFTDDRSDMDAMTRRMLAAYERRAR